MAAGAVELKAWAIQVVAGMAVLFTASPASRKNPLLQV